MADLDDILRSIISCKRGAFKDYSRLVARIEAGVAPPPPPKCDKHCLLKDQPLIGRKEFCDWLGVEMWQLQRMDRYVGIPHAVIGNRWMGTTHTLMRWLTRLVEENFKVYYGVRIDPTVEDDEGEYWPGGDEGDSERDDAEYKPPPTSDDNDGDSDDSENDDPELEDGVW